VIAPVTVPRPVIVPVLNEMPLPSVSDPPLSSCTVPVPTDNAVPTVNPAANSSVPLEEKVTVCAALVPSSTSRSPAPVTVSTKALPPSVMPFAIVSVPPFAVMCAAPLAVIAPVTVPNPVIVPVLNEMPALSVKCELDPSSWTVLAPIDNAAVSVSVPEVLSSRVPVDPEKLNVLATLVPSSKSRSLAPLPTVSVKDPGPVLLMFEAISNVPPEAVI
jgi:hypothetical protein